MLSIPLLKRSIKANVRLWLECVIVLSIIMAVAVAIYQPDFRMKVVGFLDGLPGGLRAVLGMGEGADTLTGYLASNLFGFLFLIVPMLYEIAVANRLVAGQVESGTMAYLVSTPNTRKCIVFTQAYFLMISIFLMFFCMSVVGMICCWLWMPGELAIPQFLLLNLGAFCLHICISGISFLAACISDEMKTSLMIGAGLPVLFLLIRMLANLGGGLEVLQYVTIFTLYSPGQILDGSFILCIGLPLLAIAGLVLYMAGIKLFEKRDLPL